MTDLNTDTSEIKSRAKKGAILLSLRNLGLQSVSILGFFILTILLGVRDVGIYGIVLQVIGVLNYFSDLGLSAALLQQKEYPSTSDLRTSFTIQLSLSLLGVVVMAYFFPNISSSKSFGTNETMIFYALLLAFISASLRTIPTILLERDLHFQKISLIDISENIVFYLAAVIFALLHFGSLSFAFAIILRSIVGLILTYTIQPWKIGFDLNLAVAKKLLTFGIPLQVNSILAAVKDNFSQIYLVTYLGVENFAYLTWSQKVFRSSISLMDSATRVTFPLFSRLQHDTEELKKSIEKTLEIIATLTFPLLAFLINALPLLTQIIPKYQKWQPALVYSIPIALSFAIASLTTPLSSAFNSVGKVKINTKFMLMWTILTWIGYIFAKNSVSPDKFGWVIFTIGVSSFFVWNVAGKIFNLSVYKIAIKPFLLATTIYLLSLLTLKDNFMPIVNFCLQGLIFASLTLLYIRKFVPYLFSYIPKRVQK